MATLYSTTFLGATISVGSMAAFNGGYVDVFDGAVPVAITDPATGTKGAHIVLDSPRAFYVNSGGILTTLYPPARVNGLATITPTYMRVYKSDNTVMAQLEMGQAGSGKAVEYNAGIVAGQRVQLDSLLFRDTSNIITAGTTATGVLSSGGVLAGNMAEYPRQYMDTTAPVQTGATLRFGPGETYASPIAAYNAANWGDRCVGKSGFDYTPAGLTDYYQPKAADTAPTHRWITIEPETLPCAEGIRTSPTLAAAANVFKYRLNGTDAMIRGYTGGMHHIRFIGFEMLPSDTLTFSYFMVWTGPQNGTGGQGTAYTDLSRYIVFDRIYAHGSDSCEVNHGLALMGDNQAIVDSHLSNFHYSDGDCQAICAWAGKGPYKITNNFIEGLGENLMFGGSESIYANVVPADIEIRYNTISKNPAWYGAGYLYRGTKTLLELKAGVRVLIEGNVLENNWEAGVAWFAPSITMKSSNQTNDNTKGYWRCSDVIVINNVVRRSANVINWSPIPNDSGTPMARLYVNNLLAYEMDYYKGNKWDMSDPVNYKNRTYMAAMSPSNDAILEHITVVFPDLNGQFVSCGTPDVRNAKRVTIRNNICAGGKSYPLFGDSYGYVDEAFSHFFDATSSDVTNNVVVAGAMEPGGGETALPVTLGTPKNHWIRNTTDASYPGVGFNDIAAKDFSLSGSSPHKNYATDGKDPGAVLSEMTTVLTLAGLIGGASVNHARLPRRRFRMQ